MWVDHSTTDYEQTEEMAERVAGRGGRMLEAPVTGGLEALKKGQMTVFLAGEADLAREMRPMMEDIYQKVIYTGKMGAALVPKVTRSGSANYLVLKFLKDCKITEIDHIRICKITPF